jgi:hypothetical protein
MGRGQLGEVVGEVQQCGGMRPPLRVQYFRGRRTDFGQYLLLVHNNVKLQTDQILRLLFVWDSFAGLFVFVVFWDMGEEFGL